MVSYSQLYRAKQINKKNYMYQNNTTIKNSKKKQTTKEINYVFL